MNVSDTNFVKTKELTAMQRDRVAQLSVEIKLLIELVEQVQNMAVDDELDKRDIADYLYDRLHNTRIECHQIQNKKD